MGVKYLILLLLIFPQLVVAQVLRGQVQDPAGRAVPFVSVAVPALAQGTTADESGHFVLTGLPAGSAQLQISAIGYVTATQTVLLPTDKLLLIKLKPEEKALDEVVGSSRVDLQACKLEYSIVSPK